MWSIIQDHVNGDLLFAGTEFGLFVIVRRRHALGAAQGRHADDPGARHDGAAARERPRARDVRPRVLHPRRLQRAARDQRRRRWRRRRGSSRCATRRSSTRPAWRRRARPASARWPGTGRRPTRRSAPSSPTPSAKDLPADAKLVLTITDETGKQVRRLDLDKTVGLRRVAWNLRGDPPAAPRVGQRAAGRARPARRVRRVRPRARCRRCRPGAIGRRSARWSATR